jgi:transcription-repair coupling factor (superfamily II helicase)
MREKDLEQVMLDFYHRRFNVLVSTTIIESGIDVPTANTILINRADRSASRSCTSCAGASAAPTTAPTAYLIAPPRRRSSPTP